MKRALIFCLFIAVPAFAQEYGRASAGTIDLLPKSNKRFDGSFSMFSGGSFGATTGGTLMKDRVWFFASADRQQPIDRTRFRALTLPKDFLSLRSTTVLSPSSFVTIDVHSTR